MSNGCSVVSGISRSSYGIHLLYHLASNGAGLAGSQIAVVALLQIDAHLVGGLHLEAVHGLAGVGVEDAVAAAAVAVRHSSLSFLIFVSVFGCFLRRMEHPHISLPESEWICENSISSFL